MELLLSANPIPLPIKTEDHIGAVSAGRAHSLVLVEESKGQGGRVLTFGNNSYGQCGRAIDPEENYNGSKTVHQITNLGGSPIQSIVCGQDHSVFVNTLGQVYACGWGDDGQTGQGTPGKLAEPTIVQGDIAGEKIVQVACKSDCNLAINGNLSSIIRCQIILL
jgi:RCC1-like G exchanging factor-like protein